MRIVCLSDTHGQHPALQVPAGDVVIHAGDISKRGELQEISDFLQWFSQLPHLYKVFVGGNHDFLLEKEPALFKSIIPANCIYLQDTGGEIAGIRLWGSPITPYFFNWAFNRHRGDEIKKHWDLIPANVDVLVTHGPPYGILDQTVRGQPVGCEELLVAIQRVKPRIHLFGHIHEGYGVQEKDNTRYVNASVLDVRYRLVNQPIVIDV